MNDDDLDAALGDLAREDAMIATPAQVEARTLAAYDAWAAARKATPAPRVSGRRWLAASAMVLAASGVFALVLPRPLPPRPAPSPPSVPFAASPVQVPPATAETVETHAAPVLATARQRSARRAPTTGGIESAAFTPLTPDAETGLSGSFQLSRVRVPRDVLVDLGLLVDAHRGGESVQADVVFGEDGLARAIRLAPVSRRVP